MDITPLHVPLWVELIAAGLGGLQGAMFAAGVKDRRIDVLGVIVIGVGVSLGGSLLRDIVLNQQPIVVWSNWYVPVASACAVIGMALQPLFVRATWVITVLDAVVMGLFGAIGATKALSLGVGEVGALLVGVVGAIGGSLVRDLLLGIPVAFLQVGSLYAVAAAAGSAILIVLAALGTPVPIAGLVGVLVTTVVRLGAVRFDWTFPEQRPLRAPRRRARRA
ncbi:trimeric intracellular cation channel family protein [Microbacterium ulmi]|uniref:Glycine transporter domain-containing protein n=1 Tax=Microbacterium ulmi TaxID=179095 RepID=A0A7Y2M045_9MICO|nr:TRIC cation channel family protein [Microbacterium ulmi]NII68954.1 putative membrane protein YeiH [Microbacterium ulmi]NNH03937.1 hypothetical protein [Microbacterium ulmi]